MKQQLRKADRIEAVRAMGLAAPLFALLIVTFLLPIALLLFRAVQNPEVAAALPQTLASLASWDGRDVPGEATFAAFAVDLREAGNNGTLLRAAKRLNYEIPGIRKKLIVAARLADGYQGSSFRDDLLATDSSWGNRDAWVTIKRAGHRFTSYYLVTALDLKWNSNSQLVHTDPTQSVFVDVLMRTLDIAFLVTLGTLLLGFPIAYLLASVPTRISNLLMILVLMPFWTSLLVRTTAWVVLLQTNGVINDFLLWTGIFAERQQLIFSRFGTLTAMIHIQLPFTILPIYSVMKSIPKSHMRAALSLGARPLHAFRRVYLPQTMPGVAAGCLLTFILSLGYYITPALVGGANDQMVSNFVANYINRDLNWGMAAALSAVLLVATLALYFVYSRLLGTDKIRLG